MPATTLPQMDTGRTFLRSGGDLLHVIITAIDLYTIKDVRPSADTGREALATSKPGWTQYDYDTARTTFNLNMPNLS